MWHGVNSKTCEYEEGAFMGAAGAVQGQAADVCAREKLASAVLTVHPRTQERQGVRMVHSPHVRHTKGELLAHVAAVRQAHAAQHLRRALPADGERQRALQPAAHLPRYPNTNSLPQRFRVGACEESISSPTTTTRPGGARVSGRASALLGCRAQPGTSPAAAPSAAPLYYHIFPSFPEGNWCHPFVWWVMST